MDLDNYHDEKGYLKELPADKNYLAVISPLWSGKTFQIKKTDLRIHVFVIFTYAGANNDFKNKKKISISPYSSFYFLFLMAGVCSCVLSGVCMRACVCVNVLLFQPIYPFSSSSSSSSSINFLL